VPLAPDDGAVNTTVAPLTGLLPASFTVTWSVCAKAEPTVAVCGVPALAVIEAAVPLAFVRLNEAEEPSPDTEAVTA
jgi:hypothetical protein